MKYIRTALVLMIIAMLMICPLALAEQEPDIASALADEAMNAYATEADEYDSDSLILVNFSGVWVLFEDYASQLMVPDAWVSYNISDEMEAASIFFYAGTEDGSQTLKLQYVPADLYDLYAFADTLTSAGGYENVRVASYNDVDYLIYELPSINSFGAYTLAGDGMGVFNFIFSPADQTFFDLARQIMVTMSELDYAGLDSVG